jgi:diphthine synthase
MLLFIGLGLHDEKDITLRGLEEARSCDLLFAEFYTSRMVDTNVKRIEGLIGKKIRVLSRAEIEEKGGEIILEPAKKKRVGLLVAGDPLISTTHIHLRLEAKKLGIESKVIHNASIYSAAPSISGLQNYKFGKSATVAMPEKGFFPETPYSVLKENKELGLHTLLFLDIKVKEESKILMTANEAMKILLQIEERRKEGIFTQETLCIVLGGIGSFDYVLRAGRVEDIIDEDFGPVPHSLIVPGILHFMEEEYLKEFGGLRS